VRLPERFTVCEQVPLRALAASEVADLPEGTHSSVGAQVHVLSVGERSRKGWALADERLGDGWRGLQGGHVNMGHNPDDVYGYIPRVIRRGSDVLANLAISRRKLEARNQDPTRLTTDMAVSVEWTWLLDGSAVTKGDKKYTLAEAAEAGLIDVVQNPTAKLPEVIATDPDTTIWCSGVEFHDLALVDLQEANPAFPSARILYASAAEQGLDPSKSMEAFLRVVETALVGKYKTGDSYPYRIYTFSDAVVWEQDGKYWSASVSTEKGGTVVIGEKAELEQRFVEAAAAERLGRKGGPYKAGPGGGCVCPKCGATASHDAGEPCTETKCPKCGAMMVRKDVDSKASLDPSPFVDIIYGMGSTPAAKKSGHKSAPKGYPTQRSQYADPANYKYPLDTEAHAKNASARFHYAVSSGEYSRAELVFMAKRIVSACRRYGVDVSSDSLVGKYAGLKRKSGSNAAINTIDPKGGESVAELTEEKVREMCAQAKEDGRQEALNGLQSPESELRKQIADTAVEEFKVKQLPALLEEAQGKGREEVAAQNAAVDELSAIHPLTDDEKKGVVAAMVAGEFNLAMAKLERENRKLKGEFKTDPPADPEAANRTAAAAAVLNPDGSGTGAGADTEDPPADPVVIF